MRQTFKITIQSYSDIITNSSSEVFVINTPNHLVESTVEDILSVGRANMDKGTDEGSGMGGELGVYTWKNGFRKFKHTREKYRHDNSFTPEKWTELIGTPLEELKKVILVDIDWSRQATIEHIELFYGAMVDDDYWLKYDFIDWYVDYDNDAPYNEDLEEFDNEAWLNDYIIAMRDAGYSEKEIQKVIEEERNNMEDLNND